VTRWAAQYGTTAYTMERYLGALRSGTMIGIMSISNQYVSLKD